MLLNALFRTFISKMIGLTEVKDNHLLVQLPSCINFISIHAFDLWYFRVGVSGLFGGRG